MSYRRLWLIGAVIAAILGFLATTWSISTARSALQAVGIRAEGCRPTADLGSGLLLSPERGIVLTSAHVVAGATTVSVIDDGIARQASIVGFDPSMDLAYLQLPAQGVSKGPPPADLGRELTGASARALVHRDGESVALDVIIERPIIINTEDIYLEGETARPGFELAATISLGDSGGAVIHDDEVVAVLWARNRNTANRSYAIDFEQARARIDQQLSEGDLGDVDVSRCPR